MKEIKVQITGYKRTINKVRPYPYTEFTVQPLEVVPEFDFSKNYKLVEDVSNYVDTDMIYKTTSEILLNGVYGGIHLPTELTPVKFPDSELIKCYCENDVKQIRKLKMSTTYGVFKKARVMFNGNATILEIGDFKTVVKCHEDDEFVYSTGLGLALYRYYKKQPGTKKDFKCLSFYMNYEGLAEYCFEKYFGFDIKRIHNFLRSCENGKWVDLC